MSGMQSATRVVKVVEHLATSPLSRLDDIAELLGVHKSNAYRLLATLRELDWVSSNDDHTQYSLGPKMLVLGRSTAPGEEFVVAQGIAADIASTSGETVNLSIAGSDSMVTVWEVPSFHDLRVTHGIGTTDPFHSSAVGKLHLASLDEDTLHSTLNAISLEPLTPATIASRDALVTELDRTRTQGFSMNVGEQREGISAYALPLVLRDSLGRRLYLSLTAPSARWPRERIEAEVARLRGGIGSYVDDVRHSST